MKSPREQNTAKRSFAKQPLWKTLMCDSVGPGAGGVTAVTGGLSLTSAALC